MTLTQLNNWFYNDVLWRTEFRKEGIRTKWQGLSTQDKQRIFVSLDYRLKNCDKLSVPANEIVYEIFDRFKPSVITVV